MPSLKQFKHAIRNMAKIDVSALSKIDGLSNSVSAIERNQALIEQGQSSIAGDIAVVNEAVKSLSEQVREISTSDASSVLDGKLVFEYTYTPSIRNLKKGPSGERLMAIFDQGAPTYREHLAGIGSLSEHLLAIPVDGSYEAIEPFWGNGWFEALDAASLYYFLAKNNPTIYMEVGSGNSTKFARRAINDHGLKTKIISIDPQPRADIDKLCDEVIRERCEDVDQSVFGRLSSSDVLFIDNSHRSFQGSDVTVFFTEILPALPKGTLFGVHDVFLPFDYPSEWLDRFYNEQYLLLAYIHGGMGGGTIELPVFHVSASAEASKIIAPTLGAHIGFHGGAFWMRR